MGFHQCSGFSHAQSTLTDFNLGTKSNAKTPPQSANLMVILFYQRPQVLQHRHLMTISTTEYLESRWTVDKSSLSQWISIDLRSIFSINTVKVYQSNFPNYFTQDYQIQISTDNVAYTTVGTNTLQASINNVGTNTFTATNARYVKIVILSHYLTPLYSKLFKSDRSFSNRGIQAQILL